MKSSPSTEASDWLRTLAQSHPARRFFPWFLLCCLIFLYLQTFLLPHTPLWFSNDAMVFLNHAARMLDGEAIYRDFFQITTPGTEIVYFFLFKLFGPRAWIHNAVIIALGLSLTWLCLVISSKVIAGWKAFLPSLLFLALQFRLGLGGRHHWFSTLLVLAAVAVIIKRRNAARLTAAGVLCGLASFFTQTRGVAAVLAFAIFVGWEHRRQGLSWRVALKAEAYLGAAFVGTLVVTLAYFVWQSGLERFLYCTVMFPLRYYRSVEGVNTWSGYLRDLPRLDPEHRPWRWGIYLFTYALVPFVYVWFLLRYWRESRAWPLEKWSRLMLLNLVGLSLFIGVASSPIWYRLNHIALPGLILLVWMLDRPGKVYVAFTRLMTLAALAVLIYASLGQRARWPQELDLPAGRVAFQRADLSEPYQWLAQHTQPAEYFYATSADFFFLLRLRNPAAVTFLFPAEYTRPEQVQQIIAGLEEHEVKLVYWRATLDLPPGNAAPAEDHLEPLRNYLRDRYKVVKKFTQGDYVWERKP